MRSRSCGAHCISDISDLAGVWYLRFSLNLSCILRQQTDPRAAGGGRLGGEQSSRTDDWCLNSRAFRKRGLTQPNPANCYCKKKKTGSAEISSAFQRKKVIGNVCVPMAFASSEPGRSISQWHRGRRSVKNRLTELSSATQATDDFPPVTKQRQFPWSAPKMV